VKRPPAKARGARCCARRRRRGDHHGNVTVHVALVVTVRIASVLRPGAQFGPQLPDQ
jgi:hypothetical protein